MDDDNSSMEFDDSAQYEAIYGPTIFGHVMSIEDEILNKLGLVLVEKDLFHANVQKQGEHFFLLVRAIVAEKVKDDDVLALVNDCMYTIIPG